MNRRNIKRLEQLEISFIPDQRKGMTVSVIDPVTGELVDFSRYKDSAGAGVVTFNIDLPSRALRADRTAERT